MEPKTEMGKALYEALGEMLDATKAYGNLCRKAIEEAGGVQNMQDDQLMWMSIDAVKGEPTFPMEVNGLAQTKDPFIFDKGRTVGDLVAIRPVGKEHEGKTFLGFYIGDLPTCIEMTYLKEDKILGVRHGRHNPAIFIPELRRIVFGYESWWAVIKSEDDFKKITDEDIDNLWYVKLWREMHAKAE